MLNGLGDTDVFLRFHILYLVSMLYCLSTAHLRP